MLNLKRHITLVIGATALFIDSVNAHAYMTKPKVEWVSTLNDGTSFVATIQSAATGWPGPFNGPPSDNTKNFVKGFKTSNYTDLRDFVEKMAEVKVPGATMECGQTTLNATAKPLPEKIEWTSFAGSHEGGCLCACDDVVVFKDDNCAVNYNTTPAVMPYDKASCVGASVMRCIWMALHSPEWQVYINCAPLEGGTNVKTSTSPGEIPTGETPAETPTPATSPAEAPTAETPTAETPTAATSPAETPYAETPTAETSTTSAETLAPPLAESPALQSDYEKSEEKSKEKCVRRRTRD